MAEGQSPENSPPSPTPPSPPSSDNNNNNNNQQQSPPSPSSSSTSPSSSPPAPPPPENSSDGSSSSPPPPSSGSQSPPSPPQGNNNNNNGGNNDNNNNGNNNNDGNNGNNNNGNNNNGNNNDNNNNNGDNNNKSNGGGNNNRSPPPPSRNSDRNSPPPPRSLAPPRSSGGGSNSSRNDAQNTAAIIGIAAGAGLLFLVMILFCVCCCRKKKKKHQMPDYASNGYATSKGSNGNNNWMSSPPPPPPGSWQPSPPPPPPPVSGGINNGNSSDMSSNYSGPHGPSLPPPHPSVALGFNKSTFTYDELAAATQGFSQARLLGQGGFGYVYKGILPNGKEIAVKSLKAGSGQGEREFQAEVEIISRVHHRFLVSLVGYCIAGGQRMLVYEFLPNDTLEFHLHGKSGNVLDWPTRLRIALGSAKGLAYLHEDCHPKIIHRDIKASNILLDESFEAKVADFGLAKLSQDNVTHVSTRIMGTFGYLAPEYASSGKLTDRSDVFSFGVMLLELITGRRPVDLTGEMEDSLVDWARPLCLNAAQDGDYSELVDPRLENQYEPHEMARMVACAAAAVRHSARRRPKMSQIVRALEGDASLDDLNEGAKPGQSSFLGRGSSSDYDSSTYSADMRKFRKVALDSHEYGASSEYGNTSEYGLDPSSSSSEEIRRGGATNNKTTHSREL
ncbi:putative proline-rich receptor-like protein kinase PERK6 isoform X2 [Eutrema salsugineum]|uniref:putative proline-rich receptor-like protein kinase PERK6 isoform X2 n=1 Tax=Eutrema salsugineum TaxID=72664 RepID=UPI000CED27C1|nr:putative proline-rich receptor-like protein kinase PERK6 isoform X2 [Eutrema salsugineum]